MSIRPVGLDLDDGGHVHPMTFASTGLVLVFTFYIYLHVIMGN